MRFGAVFPTTEIGVDPAAIRDLAQRVEALGFDHLITYDHGLGAPHQGRDRGLVGPYDERDEFHEPFVLYGYLAAVTRLLELVVGVLVVPQRQTALVAKQAAEVQLLSGGDPPIGDHPLVLDPGELVDVPKREQLAFAAESLMPGQSGGDAGGAIIRDVVDGGVSDLMVRAAERGLAASNSFPDGVASHGIAAPAGAVVGPGVSSEQRGNSVDVGRVEPVAIAGDHI